MRAFRSLAGVVSVLALLASGCSEAADPASDAPASRVPSFPVTMTDDEGVEVTLPAEPQRIVTFAPSNTEIVYALGLGDRLVGVSGPYDDFPAEAKKVEEIGGAGDFGVDPNVEKVVSLEPDLMLAISGGEQWKQKLRDLGVPVFTINATDFADLLGDIRTVGELTGTGEEAARLTATMQTDADAIAAEVGDTSVSCFYEVYFPHLTTVGPNTFIFDLLERAGCDPVSASAKSDYPQWSVDELVADGPQVYLVSSESGVSEAQVTKRPGFGAIDAVAEGRVVLMDSDLVSRPGPRVVDGLQDLSNALRESAP